MAEGEDRVLTVPNLLSVGRLLCLPLFLWLLFGRENRWAAAVLLAVLGASDCLDGYIARRFDQVSKLGKVLDPTADRILITVGVVAILVDGSAPLWVGVLAIVREVAVFAGAMVLLLRRARRVDVQVVGKAATFALMVAFPLFLASNPDGGVPWDGVARVAAWVFVVPGLVLSWYAAVAYVPLARDALADRNVGSGGGGTGPSALRHMLKDGSP